MSKVIEYLFLLPNIRLSKRLLGFSTKTTHILLQGTQLIPGVKHLFKTLKTNQNKVYREPLWENQLSNSKAA